MTGSPTARPTDRRQWASMGLRTLSAGPLSVSAVRCRVCRVHMHCGYLVAACSTRANVQRALLEFCCLADSCYYKSIRHRDRVRATPFFRTYEVQHTVHITQIQRGTAVMHIYPVHSDKTRGRKERKQVHTCTKLHEFSSAFLPFFFTV